MFPVRSSSWKVSIPFFSEKMTSCNVYFLGRQKYEQYNVHEKQFFHK